MIDDLLAEAGHKMDQAVDHVQAEFSTVRTGRANPAILHRVTVDYYGVTDTPAAARIVLGARAPTSAGRPPYDKRRSSAIDKAIRSSDLGLNPPSDGSVLRVAFPPLTEERRQGADQAGAAHG